MTWIAASIIGGALIGGIATNRAGNQAASAANNATNAQQDMFRTTNQQQAPWRQAGMLALRQLFPQQQRAGPARPLGASNFSSMPAPPQARLPGSTGVNGSGRFGPIGTEQTDPNDPSGAGLGQEGNMGDMGDEFGPGLDPQFQTSPFEFDREGALRDYISPAYEFMKSQGLGAITNSAAGQSGLVSGNALKGLSDYASNYALNSYLPALQTGYANQMGAYNANQANTSNIFNRLSTIAGLGSASANTSAGVGAQTGANIGNSMIAGGQAQAAGTMGIGNAISGGLNNLSYLSMLNSGNLGGGGAPPPVG